MSGLVSYESSSDEEEQSLPNAAPSLPSKGKSADSAIPADDLDGSSNINKGFPTVELGEKRDASTRVDNGPMLGPIMPAQMQSDDNVLEQQDSAETSQQHMSERETIHLLTQATHPMTAIPPSPPGSPDPAMDAKFKRFLELKAKGVHFNEDLAKKSTFHNPGLLATMMARAGVEGDDQYRTSLPREVWDPLGFPPLAYKEELLRSQQILREQDSNSKKSLSAAGKRTIEFTSGGRSGASSRESTPGTASKRKRPG
ncbi:uncharacterized protein Z520_06595 [Fonsecaea multimorphosa CBS 102226]|uniref:HCNGP-like protein n=1 Tax=Fonsecaea multimorphosa CBS 102226 TaxID=1442371 RepID=A0A0D2JWB8_9EURO|nr:uncharacterized protein Z520_06595 [Fonsecaea multimorphosa CBS 102226]KIX97817.1 hypothetical protein Z520_06595 [Fonsecaea multimorphosa CBS 102226]OAL23587.1 hypothetical protein AYO22_06164 [Fonsecaea multimorphosa]